MKIEDYLKEQTLIRIGARGELPGFVCAEQIVYDAEAFVRVVRENDCCITGIRWWHWTDIKTGSGIGYGGPRDPRAPEQYFFSETYIERRFDRPFKDETYFKYFQSVRQAYPEFVLYPAFDVIRKGDPWQATVSHTTDPQGKHSSHIPYDLDVICAYVTKSRCFRVRLNRLLRKDPDYLEKHCITCHVSEDNLRALLRLHGKNLKNILHCIIDFAAPQSITDQLLREILCMKSQSIRTDCVISLSHKRLPAAQLMQLCKTDICFECYFSLIVELYVNAQYSTETLSQAIAQFMASPFASMWRQLQKELQESTPSSPEKKTYIQSLQSTDQ